MTSDKWLELLEPKIGLEAAKIAIQSRYNMLLMAGIALTVVVVLQVTPIATYWIVASVLGTLTLVALTIAVYRKIRLAKLISLHLGTSVAWYSVPGIVPNDDI